MATAVAAAAASVISQIETQVQAAIGNGGGLAAVQALAPLMAQLATVVEEDLKSSATTIFTQLEGEAVTAEQNLVLATKGGVTKMLADLSAVFTRATAAPAA